MQYEELNSYTCIADNTLSLLSLVLPRIYADNAARQPEHHEMKARTARGT
jgi:hypothetical protein